MVLDEKSYEYLCLILWQSIQHLLRFFSVDQSGGLTDTFIPRATLQAQLKNTSNVHILAF